MSKDSRLDSGVPHMPKYYTTMKMNQLQLHALSRSISKIYYESKEIKSIIPFT